MNPITPNDKPENSRFHNNKPNSVRTSHKPQTSGQSAHNPSHNLKNDIRQTSQHNYHSKIPSNVNKGSKGSYQYGNNKGGRRPKAVAQAPSNTQIVSKKKNTSYSPTRKRGYPYNSTRRCRRNW